MNHYPRLRNPLCSLVFGTWERLKRLMPHGDRSARDRFTRAGTVLAIAGARHFASSPAQAFTQEDGTVSSNRRSSSLRIGAVAVVLALLAGHVARASGGHACGRGGWGCWSQGSCAPCNYEMVEPTVYVPRSFVENRPVKSLEYRHETREET